MGKEGKEVMGEDGEIDEYNIEYKYMYMYII